MNSAKMYGNIKFTEKGLEFTKAYSKDENAPTPRLTPEMMAEALNCAKDYIKGRMAHCIEQLNQNAYRATMCSENKVVWAEGHFSRPVYDAMEGIETAKTWNDLNKIQMQQIVRALHCNERVSDKYWGTSRERAFNIATEYLLCM